jgi:hypothetical protein
MAQRGVHDQPIDERSMSSMPNLPPQQTGRLESHLPVAAPHQPAEALEDVMVSR